MKVPSPCSKFSHVKIDSEKSTQTRFYYKLYMAKYFIIKEKNKYVLTNGVHVRTVPDNAWILSIPNQFGFIDLMIDDKNYNLRQINDLKYQVHASDVDRLITNLTI